jgi:hypothetical protein
MSNNAASSMLRRGKVNKNRAEDIDCQGGEF